MSGVSGDFTGLRRLIGRLKKAANGGLVARMAQELAAGTRKLIADEFRYERDPYGVPWAPLRHRKGRILRDTGYLAGHVGIESTGNGIRVTFLAPYAGVHQHGASIKPHRRKAREMARSLRTGLFMKGSRTKSGAIRRGAQTFTVLERTQAGYQVPRRMLLPSKGFGGLGPVYTKVFNRISARVVRQALAEKASAAGGEG